MQQDLLLPTLTVRETLQYTAVLRLPFLSNAKERRAVVESVILELGLKECANTRIGSSITQGMFWWRETQNVNRSSNAC